MFINPVVEDEVTSIIKCIKDSSPGWDAISARVMKATHRAFITPLTHVMNLSLTLGVFPTELKIARVIPLNKSGDASLLSNYRPVSVLPAMSKILERLMYNRLLSFINSNGILYNYQFGFRESHSPNLAMILLVDKISNALENGEYVLGLFLDFSKAFDTVNHEILFKKLEFYGVRGVALQWFHSYFFRREQYVEFEGIQSSRDYILCGVPQGSILGPLLFLLYINDLANVSTVIFSLLFADDSNMFLSGKCPDELINIMNTEIIKILDWLALNKLSLNVSKTHFMFFRRKRSKIMVKSNLIIKGEIIDMVEQTKFLGIVIDSSLTFLAHIQYIKGKIARGLGIICKARKYFLKRMTLYNAFIHPYFAYCIPVWGNTYKSYLDPLVKLQKRLVRIICGSPRNTHSAPLFSELNILTVSKLYIHSVQMFMYKFHHGNLPEIFTSFYTVNRDIHNYRTRQYNCLHVPKVLTDQAIRWIRYTGVICFNYFSRLIPLDRSFVTYKKLVKRFVLFNDTSLLLHV